MKCPNCNEPATKVLETRAIPERDQWNKRRRKCLACGFIFWTIELPAEDLEIKNGEDAN
jgi:transcriptional regulator NrdR family protein